MSTDYDGYDENFVVTPASDEGPNGAEEPVGCTTLSQADRLRMRRERSANPDDPAPPIPPPGQARIAASLMGSPGRLAIVQGQVYIVGVILVAQLWLITAALFELLSGNVAVLWPMAIASFIGFLIALIVFFWPRQRSKGW
jgi:hypothetical protein